MRITHLVVSPQFHGTERYVTDVAGAQQQLGHRVTVVGGHPATMPRLLAAGVRWLPGGDGRQAAASLARTGLRHDVLHAHLPRSEPLAALAATPTRAPWVLTQHLDTATDRHAGARSRFARLPVTGPAVRIAVSASVAQGMPPGAVVLRNGVADAPGPGSSGRAASRTVLMANRLTREKGVGTALAAWAASGLGARGWRLLVAGDGPLAGDLAATATALGVAGSVELLGWRGDVHDLMGSAAVFLAPADVEPLGLSVLEAMARALPVVASDAPGHRETVGAAGGRLFPRGDAAACAAALVELAGDAGARERYGAALQRHQRAHLGLRGHVTALVELYADAGARRPGGRVAR